MGFLQRFLKNTFRDGAPPRGRSSFENLSDDQLEAHLGVSRYGEFLLTDAVRPSYDLQVIPRAGYRHDHYQDRETGVKIPVLMAAASKQDIFELFLDLLDPLGNEVDVVLETSHSRNKGGHQDLYREQIDLPVLKSLLYDFEEMLSNDGCTGIAVLNPGLPQEVQLDEHKLLIVYGKDLRGYENTMVDCRVPCREDMRFITEAEHVHSTCERYVQQFEELKMRLGMDGYR